MRIPALLALACLVGVSCAMPSESQVMSWPDLLERPQPSPDERIAYGPGELQFSELWRPAGAGPHPVVLMIHGGCWQTAIAERDIMNWIADDLRGRGIAVWNVEYRGVDRGGGYPETYRDVLAAAESLRANAERLGLDISNVVAVGHSAGGHLALWLAAATALPEGHALRPANPLNIATVLSQGGIPDLVAASGRPDHPCGDEAPRAMLGGAENAASSSAIAMTPGAAELIMLHGAEDRIAPPEYGEEFARAMRAHGREVTIDVIPNEGHVELISPGTSSWARQVGIIEEALRR